MGTSAGIGILNKNGTVRAIYNNYDSSVRDLGDILNTYYKDEITVNKLIDLGDISSIGIEPFDDPKLWDKSAGPSFDSNLRIKPQEYFSNGCRTYAGRGEKSPAKNLESLDEFCNKYYYADYKYIFVVDRWYYAHSGKSEFNLVRDVKSIEKLNEEIGL